MDGLDPKAALHQTVVPRLEADLLRDRVLMMVLSEPVYSGWWTLVTMQMAKVAHWRFGLSAGKSRSVHDAAIAAN